MSGNQLKKSKNKRQFGKFNLLNNASCSIFNAILDGAFLINGFANKHLKEGLIK